MNRPEPCTDWAHEVRHLSVDLAPLERGGRGGLALCGVEPRMPVLVYDEAALNRQWQEEFPGSPPIVVADLPPCGVCDIEATLRA